MSKEKSALRAPRVSFVREMSTPVPDPHSVTLFHEACAAGATASEMNSMLATIKRDRQALRELALIEMLTDQLRDAILNRGIRPFVSIKISRAVNALVESTLP